MHWVAKELLLKSGANLQVKVELLRNIHVDHRLMKEKHRIRTLNLAQLLLTIDVSG